MKKLISEPTFDVHCSTMVELLRWRTQKQPERKAYSFLVDGEAEEVSLTYRELDRWARAVAAKLQSLGTRGNRALLLYPSGLEFLAVFMGCLYSGVIAVPVYPPHPARLERDLPRIIKIANDAKPFLILTTSPILDKVKVFPKWTRELRAIPWLATDKISENLAEKWQDPAVDSSTLAFFQYTSGSTTDPKGVMMSHGNLLHNQRMIQQGMKNSQHSVGFGWLPLYHDMGLIGNVMQALHMGYPCILMSPLIFLQRPFRWLQAISRFRATISGGPNFAYDLCVRKITPQQRATLDLSSWDIAFNGAEPICHETLDRFTAYFEPCGFRPEAFYPCYGLAEATLIVSGGLKAAPPIFSSFQAAALEQNKVVPAADKQEGTQTLVGCGKTFQDQEIIIVDPESLTQCRPDQVGEIWVSGPNVTQGYWNRQRETGDTFKAYVANTKAGPFLRTGDLGFLKDGQLFVTGRLKDLIIIDGCNHYPQDIEWTVERSHPALRKSCCAAFSVNVNNREQLVVAAEAEPRYLLKNIRKDNHMEPLRNHKNSMQLDTKGIIKSIKKAVSDHHDLGVYDVLLLKYGRIPKTLNGKIQRHVCRAGYLAGSFNALET